MYQTILFDFDGTLVDTKAGITRCVGITLQTMRGEVPPMEELLTYVGPPLAAQFQAQAGMTEEEAKEAVRIFRSHYNVTGKEECEPFPGVEEMLKALKAKGKKIVIASSKPEELLHHILGRFALTSYFDIICGSIDGVRTTKEEVITEVFHQLGLEKGADRSSLLMVGDRLYDIEGAKSMGIASAGVAFGYGGREELAAYHADYIVDSWEELMEVIG